MKALRIGSTFHSADAAVVVIEIGRGTFAATRCRTHALTASARTRFPTGANVSFSSTIQRVFTRVNAFAIHLDEVNPRSAFANAIDTGFIRRTRRAARTTITIIIARINATIAAQRQPLRTARRNGATAIDTERLRRRTGIRARTAKFRIARQIGALVSALRFAR